MSLLSSIICSLGFLVIVSSLSPMRCAFLYALITDAPMSFPTLFIRSLVKVHKSSAKSHGLLFLIFIHRILLNLGLEDFPAFKPIHIISPIDATFLKQKSS